MARQDTIKKWLAYALALIVTAGLQSLVFTRLKPLGVVPVTLPLAMAALASMEGAASGAGFGIAVGVMSMYVDKGSAWVILLACLGGLITGLVAKYMLSRSFMGYMLCSLGALVLRVIWMAGSRWLAGTAALPVLLKVGALELVWTMALSPIVYALFRFVYLRWGSAYYA